MSFLSLIPSQLGLAAIQKFNELDQFAFGHEGALDTSAPPQDFTNIGGPTSLWEVYCIFWNISNWILSFAIIIGAIMIIYGGIKYMTAGGQEEEVGTATDIIKWAIIGVAVAGLAWSLITIVGNVLGLSLGASGVLGAIESILGVDTEGVICTVESIEGTIEGF